MLRGRCASEMMCNTRVAECLVALYSADGNRRCCDLFPSLARTRGPQSTQTLVLSLTVVLGLEQPASGAPH